MNTSTGTGQTGWGPQGLARHLAHLHRVPPPELSREVLQVNVAEHRPSMRRNLYWTVLVLALLGLYATTRVNYLLFHTLVELTSVVIAACVFTITWHSSKYISNPYLLVVGNSYLFIGVLDLLHTLAYKGMPIFTDYDYYANQLWIAARGFESLTLLAGFSLLLGNWRVRSEALFVLNCTVTLALVASIFYWKIFPVCFVEGQGLTPFKIYSEYAICLVLSASLVLLIRNRHQFTPLVYRLLLLSIIFTVVSELAFTFYIDNYGISNLVGHYFKLFAFLMIYRAIIKDGIEDPYRLIFKELHQTNQQLEEEVELRKTTELALKQNEEQLQQSHRDLTVKSTELQNQYEELVQAWEKSRQSEEALQRLNEELDARVTERTRELRDKDHLLIQQGRLAAMGEMINNIAHQWRQPLNALGLLVQQAPFFCQADERTTRFLQQNSDKSMALIQHMSQTIEDFRNFFRPDKEKVTFELQQEIRRTLALLEGSLQNYEVKVEMQDGEAPSITGFPNEFCQALINILMNARDALVERQVAAPRIVIRVGRQGERAVVTAADNAGGIPEAVLDKVFTPYFTTKGNKGTGVGLFMSKIIIEKNMGGRLTVRNTGEGAEFRIEL
jgi:signal transduction histidine kinase